MSSLYSKDISPSDLSYSGRNISNFKKNPTFKFGPFETSLDDITEMGYYLSAKCTERDRQLGKSAKVYLTNGKEAYRVGKVPVSVLGTSNFCLSEYITMTDIIGSAEISFDPWEYLQNKYKPKSLKFIGNRTISEYVAYKLESIWESKPVG